MQLPRRAPPVADLVLVRRLRAFSVRTNVTKSILTRMLLPGIGLSSFVVAACTQEPKQIPFDADGWKRATPIENHRTVRSRMITDLLRRHDFHGKSRQEVIDLLG